MEPTARVLILRNHWYRVWIANDCVWITASAGTAALAFAAATDATATPSPSNVAFISSAIAVNAATAATA